MTLRTQWILCVAALLAIEVHGGLNIGGCENVIIEGTNPSFTCGTFNNKLQWIGYNKLGETVLSGLCRKRNCTSNISQFNLSAERVQSNVYTSRLTIKKITRDSAIELVCNKSSTPAKCSFNMIAPGGIISDNCSVWISNRQVQGACAVEGMYASSGNYTCMWLVNDGKIKGDFSDRLTEYTNEDKVYYKGVCLFSIVMPFDQHIFTVNISIDPGPPNYHVGTLNIHGPSSVYIYDNTEISNSGTDIVMVCTAIDVYPSAVFRWNISCDNETHSENVSTCMLSTAHVEEEMIAECNASNSVFENMSSSAVYALNAMNNVKASTTSSVNSVQGGIIGGVVAVVVIIAVLGGVVIVYIKKRRKGAGGSESRRSVWGCFADFFQGTTPLSKLYAVVNKTKTGTPAKNDAAASENLYTASTNAVVCYYELENTAVGKATDINKYERDNNVDQDIEDTPGTRETKTREIPEIKLNNTIASKDISDDGYTSVTEVLTDSDLGIYHVTWETMPESMDPDAKVYSVAGVAEDDYNELHFKEDRSAQERQASDYNHLQFS